MFKDGQAYLGLARLAVIKQSGLLPVLLSALWPYGIAAAQLSLFVFCGLLLYYL